MSFISFFKAKALNLRTLSDLVSFCFIFGCFLELERILKEKLDNEIPVITVVSVMGTTEESAVDPLTEILELRKKFRTKVCQNVH